VHKGTTIGRLVQLLAEPAVRGGDVQPVVSPGPDQQHLRMFVLSHLCGPLIGLALSAFLLMLGFPLDWRLGGFTALVCLFWAYPGALAMGVSYPLLSLTSLQHLTLIILWAAHGYGGLTSPFLLWLAIVPLLAFLYSAPRIRLWLILLAMLVLNTGLFAAVALWVVPPPAVPLEALRWLAGVSLLSASAYVWMMAGYFARVLNSRNEMAQEVARRRVLVAQLDRRASDLRHLRAAKAATLARLVDRCREPVGEMLAHSGREVEPDLASLHPDLLSIEEAAKRLAAMLARVEVFTRDLAGPKVPSGWAEPGAQR
jgi:hypothetical protein